MRVETFPIAPIVIADDDTNDLFFATRALKKGGIATPVLTCADGLEVVSTVKRLLDTATLPRVVFLDIKMPQMNGFQVLKWIRENEKLNVVPVVMLSGSNEPRDTEMARALGADGYLVKPPTTTSIAEAVGIVRRHS